ncbi:MAG TPA: DoxX family protein [Pseudolabrys sp.]|nr:DoxX family protein [Hyphomicrobium sp.]HWM81994.1 DoxX family protein [Pseudolabrys sp.]
MIQTLTRYAPYGLALLRIVTALLFIEHGTQKLFGFPAMQATAQGAPSGGLSLIMLIGGLLEVGGGAAILIGLFTRPVAFILAGEMAVAYWFMHVPMGGFFPINNGGDSAILFCFVFLYLVVAGPGAWSVDVALKREGAR